MSTRPLIVLHVLVGEKGHVRTGGDFAVLLKSQRAKRCQRAGCAEQQGQRAWCEKRVIKPPEVGKLHAGAIGTGLLNEK